MAVTTLTSIKKLISQEVEIHGWDETPFICKLKRLSILNLAGKGKIPNELLSTASNLFDGKKGEKNDNTDLKAMANLIDIVCNEALVEPTMDELAGIGAELTDEQKMDIFNYTQTGVKKLKEFRK